jgi:gamma-D-glutamyl-L-lysine dipeptidyl-peptidase
MKNSVKIAAALLFLLFAATIVPAQPISYKSLSQELVSLQRQLVPDKRVAVLDIQLKDTLQPVVKVTGETDLPKAKEQIISFLKGRSISFVDSIRLLPDASVGEKTWALASSSVSNIHAKPDHTSELVSQALMGTPLKVLDNEGTWYRVQTPDYYIGWIDSGGIKRRTPKEMENWKKSDRYYFYRIYGTVYDKPKRKGSIVSDLVLGDLFEADSKVRKYLKIRTPDGRIGYVRKNECILFNEWINIEPKVESILEFAKQMKGFPYLWGGTSSKAMDCSGLVKMVWFSQGVILARDASQQAKYGEPIDIYDINNLQPGDLLFFGASAQRITHVGIYLGNGDFIHDSGKVAIGSIIPGDPKYNPKRNCVAARRLHNSLGKEGIIRVKDHPWYVVQP